MAAPRRSLLVCGALAHREGIGGSTWARLQFILGFRRLGWDVLFVDRLPSGSAVDASGAPCPTADSVQAAYLTAVMERFGLQDDFSLLGEDGTVGLPRAEVVRRAGSSELLLNIMGFLRDEEVLGAVPRRVFLDIDPGFPQMWRELGLADVFRGHDGFVTIGENVGRTDCDVPTCGLEWITIPHPVVLDEWAVQDGVPDRFTSVVSWRGAYGPVEYRGRTYGLRVHEFRRFADLPRRAGVPFELALHLDPTEAKDRRLLEEAGWSLVDPREVAGDPWSYRRYVQGSKAEFMVAKNMYVRANSGWFSDRSVCYLASGRPVLAQDTGFTDRYPSEKGLIAFATLEEAAEGVRRIEADYEIHARAAREVAEEHFGSDRVLARLLAELGVA